MNSHIYLFDRLDTFRSADLERMLPTVSGQRSEQVSFFLYELDRKLSLMAYLLLKFGLKELYGITGNPVFTFGRYGKPALRDYSEIHFNLSHCREAVVCAISDEPVGIDVEEIQVFDDETAQAVFSLNEYSLIRNSCEPEREFIRQWTRKEAFLKYRGTGLYDDELPGLLEHAGNCCFQTWEETGKKYAMTICRGKCVPEQNAAIVRMASLAQLQ